MEEAGSTRLLDYLPPQNRTTRFDYSVESILTKQTSKECFFDGGEKTQVCINLERIFVLGSHGDSCAEILLLFQHIAVIVLKRT